MGFHLVQRVLSNTTGGFHVKDFEIVMTSIHKAAVTSDVCGYDVWMDLHYSIQTDPNKKNAPMLSDLFPILDKMGCKYHYLAGNKSPYGDHHAGAYITSP